MTLHIAYNGWFWDQPYTGSGQYIRQLLPALLKRDPTLKICLIVPTHVTIDDLPLAITPIRVKLPIGGHLGKVWFEQRGYPAAVHKSGAEIAHVPYWGSPLRSSARLIVTIHDVIPLSMPVYQGGFGARSYVSLVTATARGAAQILTDSEFSREEILDRIEGLAPEMVTAIPLAAAAEMHPKIGAERDSDIREKYGLPDEYALYLGGFDVRKNLRALLAAYTYVYSALNDEYPLVLAGKRPDSLWGTPRFPDLPAEISSLGLTDGVKWIGAVDEADKPGVYRMARAAIFPSRYEGFGLGVLEAMACGTPVVAAEATSIPEVAGEAAYLVDPVDSRKMGGAIIATLIQDQLHDHMQTEGLARATQFSWRRTAEATLAVYQEVAARPSG